MAGTVGKAAGEAGDLYSSALDSALNAGIDEATLDALLNQGRSNGSASQQRHQGVMGKYLDAPDMSKYANMGGLLGMNSMTSQNAKRSPSKKQLNNYIQSLLGG